MEPKKISPDPLTKEEVKERRKYYLTNSEKKTKIYKGDKRVHGDRLCAICHTPLSTLILSTGKTVATKDHHSCYFSSMLTVNICMDSRVCQRVHRRLRKEKEENDE